MHASPGHLQAALDSPRLSQRWKAASKAACLHGGVSVLVAIAAAWLVFHWWYPHPYRELTGGVTLFLLLVGGDLVCGPLLTCVIFNPQKKRRELITDLAVVAFIQICVLCYGLHSVAAARPVYMVLEVDRFRIVTAAEIDPADLLSASDAFQHLPWGGPSLISVREAQSAEELFESVNLSLAGKEPSLRPDWWQPYAKAIPQALHKAQNIDKLAQTHRDKRSILDAAIDRTGVPAAQLVWLPLVSARTMDWIALLDKDTGLPLAYAPLDGFF